MTDVATQARSSETPGAEHKESRQAESYVVTGRNAAERGMSHKELAETSDISPRHLAAAPRREGGTLDELVGDTSAEWYLFATCCAQRQQRLLSAIRQSYAARLRGDAMLRKRQMARCVKRSHERGR